MATLHTVAPPAAQTVRGIEVENRFFVGMSLLLLATVLVGFAKSYFLAGLVRAPLPNKLIHFHALLFSCWILLLIAQATLISANRFDLHRQFGLFGFGLACGMTIVGVMAATDSLRRIKMVGLIDMRTFYAVPLFDILVFAVLNVLRLSLEARPRDPQAVDPDRVDYYSGCGDGSRPPDKDHDSAIPQQRFHPAIHGAARGIRLVVLEANSSRDFGGGLVFNCDAASRDSYRQHCTVDCLRGLDAGDRKDAQGLKATVVLCQ